jgi:hypothetical protein
MLPSFSSRKHSRHLVIPLLDLLFHLILLLLIIDFRFPKKLFQIEVGRLEILVPLLRISFVLCLKGDRVRKEMRHE